MTDVRMPGAGGLAILDRAMELDPDRPVLLMTGYATVDDAVDAIDLVTQHFDWARFGVVGTSPDASYTYDCPDGSGATVNLTCATNSLSFSYSTGYSTKRLCLTHSTTPIRHARSSPARSSASAAAQSCNCFSTRSCTYTPPVFFSEMATFFFLEKVNRFFSGLEACNFSEVSLQLQCLT